MSSNSESTSRATAPQAHEPIQLSLGFWTVLAAVLVVIGLAGFFLALWMGLAARAWQAYLVNLLFWTSIAQGGVIVSTAFYLSQGRWAGPAQYRLAEMFVGFIPLGFLLFWGMWAGRAAIFPWVLHPVALKASWLNAPFLFARDGAGLLLLTLLSLWFVSASRREVVREWARTPHNIELPPNIMRRLSPAVALCFAFVYSLLAFDLIMSLSPRWHSTLFGAWFFATAFWSGIVAMALTAIILQAVFGDRIVFFNRRVQHDLGKMVFAFSIFWVYLLFSQYLVIWYGDLPAETFFIVRRSIMPWVPFSIAMITLVWGLPFFVLLGVRPKRTPKILGTIALLGLVGIYLEDYVLTIPSLSPTVVPYGWVEAVVTIGFLGAFALCAFPGLRRVIEAGSGPFAPTGELE
ncbi:MAG TPA: hypothetical protein VMD75_08200 [Candidatus Binataceae bacterium]|nr:hypothetical protein [Candidatus Binataceae bacterium]